MTEIRGIFTIEGAGLAVIVGSVIVLVTSNKTANQELTSHALTSSFPYL